MGFNTEEIPDSTALLLPTSAAGAAAPNKIPKDSFHFAYIIYFALGIGYFLPWNSFITAVDYFSYLYPDARVDRIFVVAYMIGGIVCILLVIFYSHKSTARVRINAGLLIYVISLVVVPLMDVIYIKGRVGLYNGFYVTVAMLVLGGVADALVQGSLIGAAGELPERYMQACVAGTAASGVLVSALRVVTKAVYPQNAFGLRKSANLYFTVGIVFMVICIILYNVSSKLPVMKYYAELKTRAVNEEKEERGPLTTSVLRSRLWQVVDKVKWYGFGIVLIYLVTLAIFPGYVTEDVHSQILKDWYPILLIATYNVFDLVGKSLTSLYVPKSSKAVIGGTAIRLLFFPLFYGCLHGPKFFRTEIPVTILTGLLGLTNGYMTSVLCILAPKTVQLQQAESAGILIVLFSVLGLAAGSIVSWFWVI